MAQDEDTIESVFEQFARKLAQEYEDRALSMIRDAMHEALEKALASEVSLAEGDGQGEPRLISRAKAAEEFGVSVSWLRTLERLGQLHPQHRGRYVFLDADELRRVLPEQKQKVA